MAISETPSFPARDPRWLHMEELLLEMRTIWFGAVPRPFHSGTLLVEPEGELVGLVDGTPEQADALVAEARRRQAYVVVTPFTRPHDLPSRLRAAGYRLVQRQGTYIYEPGDPPAPLRPARRGLIRLLRRPLPVRIEVVGEERLPLWNRICYTAFGPRGQTEEESLREKERAFANMGPAGTWYLAYAGDEPAATAILYQGREASELLAVGTLPRFRGRGLATALVRRAIADFSRRGQGFLFLDTRPGSGPERLYTRLGFRPAYVRSIYGL